MLNLNYNIIGAGGYDRYSKEEAKGFIPFQVQYLIVAGGGGSAGGDNNLKAGQAGSGGGVVTGSKCVFPFNTYAITIGQGGNGGQRSATFPNYTGSNGETSSFAEFIALGGNGGYIQSAPTSSFYAGTGSAQTASFGNGGNGSQWTYNLLTSSFPPYPPFAHAGEYISASYYGGGGAGFNIATLNVEFMAIAGGGAGGGAFPSAPTVAAGGGGAGGMVTGSFAAQPILQSYSVVVGAGGLKAVGTNSPGGDGNPSSIFGFEAQGGRGGEAYPNSNGGAAGSGSNPANAGGSGTNWGGGGGGTQTTGSNGTSGAGSGGNGEFWVDGKRYGAGGGGAYTPGGGTIFNGSVGLGESFGRGGSANINNLINLAANGESGSVIIRYPGSGSKATGGTILYSGSYTYHTFTSSGTFTVNQTPDLLSPGTPGLGGGGVTASNATPNTGGGAGASFYFDSGSKGGSGFVALRYEGAPIAEGGQVVVTDHYTYHVYTASGQFYAIGNETNPNINPCP